LHGPSYELGIQLGLNILGSYIGLSWNPLTRN
jgi:hypothetical protein